MISDISIISLHATLKDGTPITIQPVLSIPFLISIVRVRALYAPSNGDYDLSGFSSHSRQIWASSLFC